MQPLRRPFITEAGEALILPTSSALIASRFVDFLQLTGLTAADVVSTPLLTIPLPQLSRSAGPRGWPATINPAAAWHPLFWLPDRIAFRYRFDEDGSDESIETDNEWAVRVGLEITLSGLYNPVDGSWYDPIAAVGLDIVDPLVQRRVSDWLYGADDELLSSIDLTEITDIEDDVHWAVNSVASVLPTLLPASWATLAGDLAQEAGELSLEALDVASAISGATSIATLAASVLTDVPGLRGQQKPAELFNEIRQELSEWSGSLDELIAGPVDQLSDSLFSIRDDFWPYVEELNAELNPEETD